MKPSSTRRDVQKDTYVDNERKKKNKEKKLLLWQNNAEAYRISMDLKCAFARLHSLALTLLFSL